MSFFSSFFSELYFGVSIFELSVALLYSSHRSGDASSPRRDVEHTSAPWTELVTQVAIEKHAPTVGLVSSSRAPPAASEVVDLLDHVSLLCLYL